MTAHRPEIPVKVPKGAACIRGNMDEKIRFASSILPPLAARRPDTIEELLHVALSQDICLGQGLILDHWRFSRIKRICEDDRCLRMICHKSDHMAFLPF